MQDQDIQHRIRKSSRLRAWVLATMLVFPLAAMAEPPGVPALQSLLSTSHMGQITKVFSGPDGMTGVVLEDGMKHTIAYLTPNGKYVFFGMMLNLATHQNATVQEGAKLIKQHHIIVGYPAVNAIALSMRLHAISYGNVKSGNVIITIFNTSNPKSLNAVADMIEQAHKVLSGTMASKMGFRFIPDGPSAGWMLTGNQAQRQSRLIDYLHHTFPGTASTKGRNLARFNANQFRNFPLPAPMVMLDLPSAHIFAVMKANHAKNLLHEKQPK